MNGSPFESEGYTHVQPNSLQFQTSDPPHLALADAAQQARKFRQRHQAQRTSTAGQTSGDTPATPGPRQSSGMGSPSRPMAGTGVISPTTYTLLGRLRSPRVSSVGDAACAAGDAPPHSGSPIPAQGTSACTTHANASPSPYEHATSAQSLLSVLKQRQQARAAGVSQVYTTHSTLGDPLPIPSAARSGMSLSSSASSSLPLFAQLQPNTSGRGMESEVQTPSSTSVYPQMRPRGPVALPTTTRTDVAFSPIPYSDAVPVLSAQLAAREGPSSMPPSTFVANRNVGAGSVPYRDVNDTEDEDEEAVARAEGAVGLAPVLSATMPVTRCLMLNLLTTWGDDHEVGLCGVELFNQRGDRIPLALPEAPSAIAPDAAAPVPVNDVEVDGGTVCKRLTTAGGRCLLLSQYAGTPDDVLDSKRLDHIATDPRSQLGSLVNGHNNTHDEANMYVMPYTPGEHHLICFVFTKPITVSMIRLINYCGRGRVHTNKGARIVEITADDVCVFRGEVAQHSGDLLTGGRAADVSAASTMDELDAETNALAARWGVVDCENILFTEDPVVLERVMKHTRADAVKALLQGRAGRSLDCIDGGDTTNAQISFTGTAARTAVATPSRKLLLSTTKDLPRGDRVHYVGGEAPMKVSARLMPTTKPSDLTAVRSAKTFEHRQSAQLSPPPAPTAATNAGPPQTRPVRAASSDGGRSRAAMGAIHTGTEAWSASPTYQVNTATDGNTRAHTGAALDHDGGSPPASRRQRAIKPRHPAQYPRQCPKEVRSVCLEFLSTWGDAQHAGLSGLRFRDANGDLVKVALENWAVQYPDGQRLAPDLAAAQLPALFDENHETACLLPFQPAMQVVFVFAAPVPRLGFLEVANYSLGTHTFCGVKDVRVFLCSAPVVPPAVSARVAFADTPDASRDAFTRANTTTMTTAAPDSDGWCPHLDVFEKLWTVASSPTSVAFLQSHRVQEVTPIAGVSLRKAPANLTQSRFQTYDLSLVSNDGLDAFDACAGHQLSSSDLHNATLDSAASSHYAPIGVGPGTGGDRLDMSSTLATGGLRAGFSTTMASFTTSLNASMNIRAAMSMKRARMMLKDRPEWLLEYQPYITPLLPVGYVCRVRLQLCARTVGEASSGSTTSQATPTTRSGSTVVYSTAAENMKSYLKMWVLKPLRSCAFVNENGDVVRPVKPGAEARGSGTNSKGRTHTASGLSRFNMDRTGERVSIDRKTGPRGALAAGGVGADEMHEGEQDDEEEDTRSLPIVAECIVSTPAPSRLHHALPHPTPAESTSVGPNAGAVPPLQVQLELLYVADSPYCLSMVLLNNPLVLDGCAAWVKRAQIFMDDTLLYDSGEAVLKLSKTPADQTDARAEAWGRETPEKMKSKRRSSASSARGTTADGVPLPQCTTSLRSCVLFTLDESILDDVYREEVAPSGFLSSPLRY